MRLALLVTSFLALASCSSQPKDTVVTVKAESGVREKATSLRSQGFDVVGVDLENKTVSVMMPDNATQYFKDQIEPNVVSTQILAAPDGQYKTPDEVAAILRDYASRYPALAVPVIVGSSLENRLIWAMKLSENVIMKSSTKKVVLVDAMHHAREVMTTEVALDMIDYLLTNYETDPKVKTWLQTNEIWIIPMFNVDGNAKVWAGESMWRKNTRGGYGVDLNRNYVENWGVCNGSSTSRNSDTYRGPSAGSEPETQAMINLFETIKPDINISIHTFSEIVIYPRGCNGSRMEGEQGRRFEEIGRTMAGKIKRDSGNGFYEPGTSWELLYATDGTSIDHFYAKYKKPAYVIEANSQANGFQPSYSIRQRTVEYLRPAWQYVLDLPKDN